MKNLHWVALVGLILCFQSIAASPFPFDKILLNIQLFDQYDESVLTSERLENLSKESNAPLKEIKLLLYKAYLLKQSGDYVKGINLAQQALLKSELAGYNEWISYSSIFLASTFRQVAVEIEAEFYLDKSKNYINQITTPKHTTLAMFNTLLEEAVQNFHKSEYAVSLNLLLSAKNTIETNKLLLGENYRIYHALLEQFYGAIYLVKKDVVKSKNHFLKSIHFQKKVNDWMLVYSYKGLINLCINQNQPDSLAYYEELIQPLLLKTDDYYLKNEYYKLVAKYYQEKDSVNIANEYLNKQLVFSEKIALRNQKVNNTLIKEIKENFHQTKKRNIITFWTLLIVIPIIALFVFEKSKVKKLKTSEPLKFNNLEDSTNFFVDNITLEKNKIVIPETDLHISADTENRLYTDLIRIEKEHFYLDKTTSLTKVANQLFTNSTYISYIIKKYRNQNFSDYIMNLRIQYLIQSLKEKEELLDSKLSYLADYAGFLSHSKFTTSFKTIVGKTPSQYIDELRNHR